MDIAIEQIGERDGKERFVLVNVKTKKVITERDVSEPTLRKWLMEKFGDKAMIDKCFDKARKRFKKPAVGSATVDDELDFDEFLSEIGLEDE